MCTDCLLLWTMLWPQGQSLHDLCKCVQVAISYLAMLIYIAVALGYIPSGSRPWAVLVTGRASLGLGGVVIVLAAVAGALGLCSLSGMWSTLIIMEASPSAVLCLRSVRLANCCMCGLPSRWCLALTSARHWAHQLGPRGACCRAGCCGCCAGSLPPVWHTVNCDQHGCELCCFVSCFLSIFFPTQWYAFDYVSCIGLL